MQYTEIITAVISLHLPMDCVHYVLMLSCVVPNVIAVFKLYSLLVILWTIIYIIFSSCKVCVT
jgi:hypothetical protein